MARGNDFRRFMRGRQTQPALVRTYAAAEKIGVMFMVPSESGQVNWSIARQTGRMMWNSCQPECPFTFDADVLAGVKPIQFARNMIVDRFLASNCQWLVMIDDDQVMPDNWWELLGVPTADVVSGTTYVWHGSGYKEGRVRVNQYGLLKRDQSPYPECYNLTPPAGAAQPYNVPVIGTGCIAIRRHVLEAFGPNIFQFSYKRTGAIMGGEDINFSQACNAAGFVIQVHPGVRFGHVKATDLAMVAEYAEARHQMLAEGRSHQPIDMLSIGA